MSAISASYDDFKVVKTSAGFTLKIYAPPMNLVWGAKPARSRPQVPVHEMQTATGKQTRPAKPGDAEWEPYLIEARAWEEEQDQLQQDLQLVLSLRDFQWPTPIVLPDYLMAYVAAGMFPWSGNLIEQRVIYAKAVLAPTPEDLMEIRLAVNELTGVPADVIQEFREKFRSDLQRSFSVELATEAPETGGSGADGNIAGE